MYIWTVCLELDWSYSKGEWEGAEEKIIAAQNAKQAVEKAEKIIRRDNRPFKGDGGEEIYLSDIRLVSVVRGDKIDG